MSGKATVTVTLSLSVAVVRRPPSPSLTNLAHVQRCASCCNGAIFFQCMATWRASACHPSPWLAAGRREPLAAACDRISPQIRELYDCMTPLCMASRLLSTSCAHYSTGKRPLTKETAFGMTAQCAAANKKRERDMRWLCVQWLRSNTAAGAPLEQWVHRPLACSAAMANILISQYIHAIPFVTA